MWLGCILIPRIYLYRLKFQVEPWPQLFYRRSRAGNRMDCHSLDQGWHTQFLTKFQKLDGFGLLVACRVCSRYAAYACASGNRPPGIGPKLACARPLSRRKTSPNGHKKLSADSSRHALQLSSYKRPLKRPLTRSNMRT